MRTLDDAVERIWHAAQLILVEDFERIEAQKRQRGSLYAAPVRKENSVYARGMTYAFLTLDQQFNYATMQQAVLDDAEGTEQVINIFDSNFIRFLSKHLDRNADRARIIIPDTEGVYHFAVDAILKNYVDEGLRCAQRLVGGAHQQLQALTAKFEDVRFNAVTAKELLFKKLLGGTADAGGAYYGWESTRIHSGLFLALAAETKVIIVKQSVVPQEGYDLDITRRDPETGTLITRPFSRLGTGQMLLFGPKGLERRALLRIGPETTPEQYRIGEVYEKEDSEKKLPVVLQQQEYSYVPTEQLVRGTEPSMMLNRSLRRYKLRDETKAF